MWTQKTIIIDLDKYIGCLPMKLTLSLNSIKEVEKQIDTVISLKGTAVESLDF